MEQPTMSTIEQAERSTATPSSTPAVEDGHVFHRLVERVYSEGELSTAEELVADDFHGHCAATSEDYHGVTGLKAHASRFRAAFPGLTAEIDDLRSTPLGFEARLTMEGRFERAVGGVEPTCVIGAAGEEPGGRMVQISGVVSGRLADGQLRHCDFDWDIDALRNQR